MKKGNRDRVYLANRVTPTPSVMSRQLRRQIRFKQKFEELSVGTFIQASAYNQENSRYEWTRKLRRLVARKESKKV